MAKKDKMVEDYYKTQDIGEIPTTYYNLRSKILTDTATPKERILFKTMKVLLKET